MSYTEQNFTMLIDVQTASIILATSIMLFYRNNLNKNMLSLCIKFINLYLVFLQILFVIKVNTSVLDPGDLPWWINTGWCIVFYSFLTFTLIYIIEIMFGKELEKIIKNIFKKCYVPHLEINFDEDEPSDIYNTAYTNSHLTCLFVFICLIKLFYVLLYVVTIVTMLVICDTDKC